MPRERNHKVKSGEPREKAPVKWEDSARDFFGRVFDEDFWLEPWRGRPFGRIFPRVDVSETGEEVKVVADVPGVDPDKIDIEVQDNRMRISGRIEREAAEEKPYRYERSYGSFHREFTLPAKVKPEEVKAVCKNGVLTITLPKAEEEKKKKIRIETK